MERKACSVGGFGASSEQGYGDQSTKTVARKGGGEGAKYQRWLEELLEKKKEIRVDHACWRIKQRCEVSGETRRARGRSDFFRSGTSIDE